MKPLNTDNLAELIHKKHQLLTQLREIGLRQQQLVNESATAALLQLLGAKQHLIGALQLVERSLRPYQAEDPLQRQWASPADRDACVQREAECQVLLREVMDLERNQEVRMIERRDRAAAHLQRAGAAHQAIGAYSQHRVVPRPAMTSESPASDARLDLTSGGS
jgi:flagellar biosynthesis/type III secretory pathway chaperone